MFGGEGDDGVCEVVACEEPANDGDRLFVATGALAVDQDDAVHGLGLLLKSPNSYARPSLVHLFQVSEEKLRRNLVLHSLN